LLVRLHVVGGSRLCTKIGDERFVLKNDMKMFGFHLSVKRRFHQKKKRVHRKKRRSVLAHGSLGVSLGVCFR